MIRLALVLLLSSVERLELLTVSVRNRGRHLAQVRQALAQRVVARYTRAGLKADVHLRFRRVRDRVTTEVDIRVSHEHEAERVAKGVVFVVEDISLGVVGRRRVHVELLHGSHGINRERGQGGTRRAQRQRQSSTASDRRTHTRSRWAMWLFVRFQ